MFARINKNMYYIVLCVPCIHYHVCVVLERDFAIFFNFFDAYDDLILTMYNKK